jgi:hypothetical protein
VEVSVLRVEVLLSVNMSVTDVDGSPAHTAVILIGEDAILNEHKTNELLS